LFVRIQVPGEQAMHRLTCKFGVLRHQAAPLLQRTRSSAHKLGICFHVGSEVMGMGDFAGAIREAYNLQEASGVELDYLDVGGGFAVRA
jgi:ornithine decarboxylase